MDKPALHPVVDCTGCLRESEAGVMPWVSLVIFFFPGHVYLNIEGVFICHKMTNFILPPKKIGVCPKEKETQAK